MELTLIAAVSNNNKIGNGLDIPWQAKGEQLLFKALTHNQWLIVGRKTFEAMRVLPNRKYAVISEKGYESNNDNVKVFPSIREALTYLENITSHAIISGGGQIYKDMINLADTIYLSRIDTKVDGDIVFPEIPNNFDLIHEQQFQSNVNYSFQVWKK